jgi:hypothetical protein
VLRVLKREQADSISSVVSKPLLPSCSVVSNLAPVAGSLAVLAELAVVVGGIDSGGGCRADGCVDSGRGYVVVGGVCVVVRWGKWGVLI